MKRKQLKDGRLGTCSYCKNEKTRFRVQGHPDGGRTVCDSCWLVVKAKHDKYESIWGNREQSEAEFQLRL